MAQTVPSGKPLLPIPERIRAARADSRLTVEQIARELRVSTRTVAGWQSGRSRPSYERLVELAALLGKPPSYFLAVNGDGQAA
jgi:transcriptional regulator with XRE-family HTH domain